MYWKVPPKAKVYEALSAVADNRVVFETETSATVRSSDYTKAYTVTWDPDFSSITSNDNASHYQGYLGYPTLAVLMLKGRLAYQPLVAKVFSRINWKAINTKHKNDWDKAVEEVLESIDWTDSELKLSDVVGEVDRIFAQVELLHLSKKTSSLKPPAA